MTPEEKNKALFMSLVVMFQSACMQHLGKVKNPTTDAIERDLEQAQLSIDLLDMLLAKSKGNLAPEEDRVLHDVLKELKLNYVDEIGKDQTVQQKKQEKE